MGLTHAAAQTPAPAAETPSPASATPAPAACVDLEFNIYFDEWQSELTQDARDAIAKVQRDLQGCAIERVRIVGLAGARGDENDNLVVSMARAQAIASALKDGGWPSDHFEITALGEAGATVDDVSRPMRRRAHVVIDAAPPSTS
jgi:outer membrane protein OmpA-like peptidoglycan-associated protein